MEISATKRTIKGSKVKQIRTQGLIPGSIFSTKSSREKALSTQISLEQVPFLKLYKEAGESTLIKVKIEGDKTKECLISEVQFHPVSSNITSVNFYEVDLTSKITANIPVEIIGEDLNPIIKSGDAILLSVLSEVEVECLPRDLPSHFKVDVSGLKEIGEMISIAEAIHVDESKVTILTDKTEILVKLDHAQQKEEIVEEAKTVDDVEVLEKGKKEDDEDEEAGKDSEKEKSASKTDQS